MKAAVLVDFSHFANTCYYPAKAAEDAGKEALMKHFASCEKCLIDSAEAGCVQVGCDEAQKIPQYDAQRVLRTNLELKIDTVRQAIEVDPSTWVFVKDGNAEKKRQLYPQYKANRDPERFDPRPLAEKYLRDILPQARWVVGKDDEADDTIASLTIALSQAGDPVVVVSGDKDLWQLLAHSNVHIYSSSHKGFIETSHIEKAFDVTDPKYIALYKALWGDSGDNVPNAVPRMQKGLLPVIQASDGTLEDFLAKAEAAQLTPRCRELLSQNRSQVETNDKLVRLSFSVVPEWV